MAKTIDPIPARVSDNLSQRMTTTTRSRIEEPVTAEVYDDILRWKIPSRTDPHENYVVELNEAPGYDVCQCKWFVTTLGPLLKLGYTPERALAEGLVKIKKCERVSDALRCFHVREARDQFAAACVRVMSKMKRKQEKAFRHAPTPQTTPPQNPAPSHRPPPLRREDLRRQAEDLGPSPGL